MDLFMQSFVCLAAINCRFGGTQHTVKPIFGSGGSRIADRALVLSVPCFTLLVSILNAKCRLDLVYANESYEVKLR